MFVYALLISFVWALVAVYSRHILRDMNIITWFTLNIIILIASLFVIVPLYRSVLIEDIKKQNNWVLIVIIGILNIVIGQYFYFYLLKHTKNINYIMPILYTSPLFVVVLGYLVLKERISLMVFIGCVFIVIGTMIVGFNTMSDNVQ